MPNDGNETFDMEHLLELAKEKKYRLLKEELVELNEVDIASFIEELDSERTVIVFRMLPKALATEVFAELPVDKQSHIINSITDKELSEIVEELYVDDAVDLVEELPATVVRRVLQNTKPETRKLINQFLNYPENTAGSIMTAEYVGLKKTMTVEQCFAYIRHHAVDSETIYTCYVMDEKRMLDGVVTVKDLLLQPYERLVGDIMDTHVIKAQTTDDQEQVADTMNKYGLLSMPVVDSEDRLVGIITVDDVMEVMEEEATEDFEKMAAMLPSEKPYLKTGVFTLAKNRIPWLLILMLSSTITGGILVKYENAFAAIPLLLYPDAYGYRRKLRKPEQHHDHPWYGYRRCGAFGYPEGRVEGSTGRRDRWICPGGGKLYPSDDPVSGQHDDLRDRRDQPVLYGHRCEDDRMHTADRGEGLKA